MKKLNIVIDSEGVLFDLDPILFKVAKDYFKKNHNIDVVNPEGYDIKTVYNCTEEQEKEFWLKIGLKYLLLYKPRPDVVDAINRLRADGHKIYNLTEKIGTSKNTKGIKKIINNGMKLTISTLYKLGLKINKVKFDEVHVYFSEKDDKTSYDPDKFKFIKDNYVDLIVEDKRSNVIKFSEITNVLCMDSNSNKDLENVTRIHNGNDMYTETKKIEDIKNDTKSIFTTYINVPKEVKKEFTVEDKIDFYKKYREYISKLPFDQEKLEKSEKDFKIISDILNGYFHFKYKPTIINKDLFPQEKGSIIVSNHLCNKDIPLLAAVFKDNPWHLLAKIELSEGLYGKIFDRVFTVYVKREDPISRKNSTINLAKVVHHDANILIFPEGTYRAGKFNGASAVYLAQAFQKPIVPVSITDTYGKGESPIIRLSEPIMIPYEEELDVANERLQDILNKGSEKNQEYILKKR